jgi:four helix bundle protein
VPLPVPVPVPVPVPAKVCAATQLSSILADDVRMSLDHTKLDVYHRSLDLLDLLDRLLNGLPAGRAHLKDQLDRAGTSIVLNIAEGAGEFSLPDKQRFYRMAKRSATETSAIIDIVGRRGQATAEQLQPIQELIIRVVSMLTKLAAK